jgi:hypothetical protein
MRKEWNNSPEQLSYRVLSVVTIQGSKNLQYWINHKNYHVMPDGTKVACTVSGVLYKFQRSGCVIHANKPPVFLGLLLDPHYADPEFRKSTCRIQINGTPVPVKDLKACRNEWKQLLPWIKASGMKL